MSDAGESDIGQDPATAVATDVYWVMPGPRQFIETVATAIGDSPSVTLRFPAIAIAGLTSAVEVALRRAHFANQQFRWLKIADPLEVETEIGTCFGDRSLMAEQLVDRTGTIRTIVLEAKSDAAAVRCERYVSAFAHAKAGTDSPLEGPRLLALLPESSDATHAPVPRSERDIVFSGALSPEEMQAYVAVRMIDRAGPGETGLIRMLVTEFAGFDVQFAEQLMALPDTDLLGLPNSLTRIAALDDSRWRAGRWATGCYVEQRGRKVRHALYERYLSRHAGPEQRDAEDWLHRRYWRACVRTLLPWLEERRAQVIGHLRAPLEAHLKTSGGKVVRTIPTGKTFETEIADLEYNQIAGLVFQENFRAGASPRQRLAIEVCFAAKHVRDSIAHLRAPKIDKVMELTSQMGRLLGEREA